MRASWMVRLAVALALAGCDDEGAAPDGGVADGAVVDGAVDGAIDGAPPDDGIALDDGVAPDRGLADDAGGDVGDTPADDMGPPVDDRWQVRAPVGDGPIQEVAVVALWGELYVIGGFDDNRRIVPELSVYDPENDAWRSGTPLPQAMHHANAAAAGGRLWVLGFLRDQRFSEDGRSYAYDPETEVWSDGPALPAGFERGAAGVAAIGDDIYIVAGFAAGQASSAVHVFDTVEGTFERLPDLPGPPRDHMAAAAVDGLLVVIGGRDGAIGSHVPRVDIFDPEAGAWRQGADMPTSRGGVAAAAWGGRVYVIGGEGDRSRPSGVFPQVEAYDVAADEWHRLDDMPMPRHGTGAAAIDGWIYIPGGADVQAFGAVDDHARLRVE